MSGKGHSNKSFNNNNHHQQQINDILELQKQHEQKKKEQQEKEAEKQALLQLKNIQNNNRERFNSNAAKLQNKITGFKNQNPPDLNGIDQAYQELIKLTETYYGKLSTDLDTQGRHSADEKIKLRSEYSDTCEKQLAEYKKQEKSDKLQATNSHREYYSVHATTARWTSLFANIKTIIKYYEDEPENIRKKYPTTVGYGPNLEINAKERIEAAMKKDIAAIPTKRDTELRYVLKGFERDLEELKLLEVLKNALLNAKNSSTAAAPTSTVDNSTNSILSQAYIKDALECYKYLEYKLAMPEVSPETVAANPTTALKTTAETSDVNMKPNNIPENTNGKIKKDKDLKDATGLLAPAFDRFVQIQIPTQAQSFMPFVRAGDVLTVRPGVFPDPSLIFSLIQEIKDDDNDDVTITESDNRQTVTIKTNNDSIINRLCKDLEKLMSRANTSKPKSTGL